ncbi:uncharacterized protein GlcG (DUF336 family) [Rhizobium sp. BK347]|nr:uncharacterized protein GlcG (DUF336 family) [Rhizobium sp. BK252]MBB3404441.1 uncharacterized protein GlcG (DUF336 family) [Rhizobium sp. BK289]MBB3416827.1 uncharacterized protein GlcG (DUF336 family) [Rhizobium sp. BK284]MBB3484704.1 uncharacterized protein GlcG (DUF336 family) [Rhizobium sp. BK347]
MRASIVVLDQSGDLIAMARMDGAWAGAFDLALGKARTSRAFQAPSSAFFPLIQPGQPLFSVNNVGGGQYVMLPGGLPLLVDGNLVGAVGVSGGSTNQDEAIANAAVASFLAWNAKELHND